MSQWHKGIVEWIEGNSAYLSVVFSWDLATAYQKAVMYNAMGYNVYAGGPAVYANTESGLPYSIGNVSTDVLWRHNPKATFTSRGCIRKCPFCIVPRVEGYLQELDNWEVKPIVCDNNLLACSRKHFDNVVDRLKPLSGVDFNQGLDSRLLTSYHTERIAELNIHIIRLAWDDTKYETDFLSAYQCLIDAGFHQTKIRVYVLIGYNDTPEDALYRLETIRALGSWPTPMRYQPNNSHYKNEYVHPNWTHAELMRYMRYWSRLAWFEGIPFQDFNRESEKFAKNSIVETERIF